MGLDVFYDLPLGLFGCAFGILIVDCDRFGFSGLLLFFHWVD